MAFVTNRKLMVIYVTTVDNADRHCVIHAILAMTVSKTFDCNTALLAMVRYLIVLHTNIQKSIVASQP